jgi:hypothetical protein
MKTLLALAISLIVSASVSANEIQANDYTNLSDAQNWKCYQAATELCADMVDAEVISVQVSHSELTQLCGNNAKACAKLNPVKGECLIFSEAGKNMEESTAIPEVNHCFGWDHGSTANSPWKPFAPVARLLSEGILEVTVY